MMGEYLALFISAVVINNFVLTKFLGLCIFFGISKNLSASEQLTVPRLSSTHSSYASPHTPMMSELRYMKCLQ